MPTAIAFFNWQRLLLWGVVLAMLLLMGLLVVFTLGTRLRLAQDPIPGLGFAGIGQIQTGCVEGMGETLQAMFDGAAQKHKVRVALLVAQAEAESGLNPNTQDSLVGARGIMQIKPETWDDIWASGSGFDRKTADGRTLSPDDPRDPEPGIYAGAFYLKKQLDYFNDREDLALAAYNAGAGAVEEYGGIPPFEETQNYVTKILGRAKVLTSCFAAQIDTPSETNEGKIFLHWTHTDYGDPLSSPSKYHVVVFQDGQAKPFATAANPTLGRGGKKTFAVAVVGMKGITSVGQYANLKGEGGQTTAPITDAQLATFVKEVAILARREGIPIDEKHVLSEAEAASLMDFPAEKVKALMDPQTGGNKPETMRELGLPHINYGPYLGPHADKGRDAADLNPYDAQSPSAIDFFMAEDDLRKLINAEAQKLGS